MSMPLRMSLHGSNYDGPSDIDDANIGIGDKDIPFVIDESETEENTVSDPQKGMVGKPRRSDEGCNEQGLRV